MPPTLPTDWHGRRVTVMGLGRFGGGIGVTRFLAQRGARVTLTDRRTADDLSDSLRQIDGPALARLRLGEHHEDDFRTAEVVVASPAVPRDHPLLEIARNSGAVVTSELNLFWQLHRGRTVGVTGSNGKSTTSAMIHAILAAAGLRSRLGGNIGRSLLDEVDQIGPGDWTVLELSSFQLEDLAALEVAPEIAVVTNFTPNHLDRHGTTDAYRAAKQNILRWQQPDDVAVLNADDPDVSQWHTRGQRLEFTHRRAEFVSLPGVHNRANAAAAACAALAIGVDVTAIRAGLREFRGLPHRLEFVAEVEGRRFYNDSLATTPESAIAALESFTGPIVLLAGGSDKGVDLTAFAEAIADRVRAVALMGQTAEVLSSLVGSTPHHICRDFEEALRWAFQQTQSGDVVLLSPGCASYGWFRDFADRGDQFRRLVFEVR